MNPEKRVSHPVQLNLRVTPEIAQQLDAWVTELNRQGRWQKVTRADLLRALLAWGLDARPTLDEQGRLVVAGRG